MCFHKRTGVKINCLFTEISSHTCVHYCCWEVDEKRLFFISSILMPHLKRSEEVRIWQHPFLHRCTYLKCKKAPSKHVRSFLLLHSLMCLFNLCAGMLKTPHKCLRTWLVHPCPPLIFFHFRSESQCKFVFSAFICVFCWFFVPIITRTYVSHFYFLFF